MSFTSSSTIWSNNGEEAPRRMKRQQGGGGVMICAAIVDRTIIGPFKVNEGVKLNSASYCQFLEKTSLHWYKSQHFIAQNIYLYNSI